jgi:glucose/arabinose dehydrogenase
VEIRMRTSTAAFALTSALLLATALLFAPAPAGVAAPDAMAGVGLAEAWPGVEFKEPTCCVSDGSPGFLYVAEQPGRILRIAKWRGQGAVPQPEVWLDLRSSVVNQQQGGLLGCAFHPQYATNQRFFVSYLSKGPGGAQAYVLRLSEFTGAGAACNPTSEKILFQIAKSRAIHQGGGIAFGPDGMLYVGVGDGGDAVEAATAGNTFPSQSPQNPLGKMLRIDVSTPGKAAKAAGNPWETGQGWMPFIYAYGLRNPWQFDWDAKGQLWTAEPGTSGPGSREWVTMVKGGGNHGWPYFEGDRPLAQGSPAPADVVMPAFVYESGAQAGAAVAGKFYKGNRVPALAGRFVFLDYMRGEVYSLDLSSGKGTGWALIGKVPDCASVGADAQGELYVCSNGSGKIWTIIAQ